MNHQPNERPIRTALFIDFDNIFIGLRRNVAEDVAESFATNPLNWIKWIERGMRTLDEEEGRERVVLVRRCYLNPKTHHRFRPYFIRAAFRVIDCPSLTGGGKNSADILMVMDVLDTLKHETHFDEFIIFSGDADFTPVLLRLRNHDRRSAILTVGPTAEAYMSAADKVITEDIFVEAALETNGRSFSSRPWLNRDFDVTVSEEVLMRIAEDLYEEVSANGELEATRLPRIFQNHSEFTRESNWLGFYSLRRLTERLMELNDKLTIEEGDPWRVSVDKSEASDEMDASNRDLKQQILQRVSQLVANSDTPVAMARAAHIVRNEFGDVVLASQWAGAGSFRALLESARHVSFQIVTAPNTPGYLCDIHRHRKDISGAPPDPFEENYPELAELTRRVSRITGVPRMTPEEYAVVFECISSELKDAAYHLSSTSKSVRDLCIERGRSISRAFVTWVLRGIAYAEHPFNEPATNTPAALAESFLQNLLTLCSGAQFDLSDRDIQLLRRWITGESTA